MFETPPDTWAPGRFSYNFIILEGGLQYPNHSGGLDEVYPIVGVLLHSCSDSQNIRVEDDVIRIEANFFCQDSEE